MSPDKTSERIVAYLDLLGFRDLVHARDGVQLDQVLTLLTKLAHKAQNFYFGPSAQGTIDRGNGLWAYTITEHGSAEQFFCPAISAFSDNIVVSWTVPKEPKFEDIIDADICLMEIQRMAAEVCESALEASLLVRGGVAVGPLYHEGGVVFGEALIEAYELESQTAVYPRIVVAPTVLKRCVTPESMLHHVLTVEADGALCVNYAAELLRPRSTVERNAWLAGANEIITTRMADLEACGRTRERMKWAWFSDYLVRATAHVASSYPKAS